MNFITNRILRVTTWAKRHPMATILLLVLLFLAPPFIAVLAMLFSKLFAAVRYVQEIVSLPATVAETITRTIDKAEAAAVRFLEWLETKPERKYYVGIALVVINPLVGALTLAWCFLDKFKPSPAPSPQPDNTLPDPTQPENRQVSSGSIDDYWTFPVFGFPA